MAADSSPKAPPRAAVKPLPVPFHAEAIRSGLQDHDLGGLVDLKVRSWRVVLLNAGQITVHRAGEPQRYRGPALLWLPWSRDIRLRAQAGSVGGHLVMGETTLANAIGHNPEAADMRALAARPFHLPLEGEAALLADIARCFEVILREAAGGAPGSESVIEAQVRVLLVILWRKAARPAAGPRDGPVTAGPMLQQFRQILEVHFRDRWSVARYADELGVSPDRLHDICSRSLGKPPRQLIHERLCHEAQILLERSSQTQDQLGAYLGFRSPAQFNAFFKGMVGMPPGAYRKRARQADAARSGPVLRSYADWP